MSLENFNQAQHFAHRPPSQGIHLLSDPLPALIVDSWMERAQKRKSRSTEMVQVKTKKKATKS